jgi:hypothetical protein
MAFSHKYIRSSLDKASGDANVTHKREDAVNVPQRPPHKLNQFLRRWYLNRRAEIRKETAKALAGPHRSHTPRPPVGKARAPLKRL